MLRIAITGNVNSMSIQDNGQWILVEQNGRLRIPEQIAVKREEK
jgi:hypothetical protein